MSDVLYAFDEWNNALDVAEANDFDAVDAEQEGGPMAAWLCELYTHPKVNKNSEVLEAVINVIQDGGHDAFSSETYMTVLLSYRGETMTSFRHLVQEYMDKSYAFTGRFPGNPDEDDYKEWYLANCRNDNKVYAEVSSGSSLHWFIRSQW